MFNNVNRIDELFPEEVILFNESGHPYYVSPSASEIIWDDSDDRAMFNEIIKIVDVVSSLSLKLSYVVTLRTSPTCSPVECDVSRFGFGFKVVLKNTSQLSTVNSSASVRTCASESLRSV